MIKMRLVKHRKKKKPTLRQLAIRGADRNRRARQRLTRAALKAH